MKFFDWIRSKMFSVPIMQSSGWGNGGLSFSLGARNSSEYYKGWVFAAVSKIAGSVSQIKLHLSRVNSSGEKEVLDTHPAQELLKRPNEFFTKKMLFERLQSNIELYGNEFWAIDRTGPKGIPIGIYPLNPVNVTPIADPHEYIAAYKYSMGGTDYIIPKEAMIHFKTFNPKSDIIGVSTLEAVRTSVDSDEASKEYNRVFFENNAAPGVVLKYPGKLQQETIEKLREQWDSEFQGFKKGYRTAVLSGGLDVSSMDVTHADMEFIEGRKMNRDEILAIFGVPKTIIGVVEDVNFASAKTALFVFSSLCIDPKMTAIQDTLQASYLPMFADNQGMIFEYESPIKDDVLEKIAYYNAGVTGGWLTLNDVRRFENLIELEDGDSVFVPFNMQPFTKPKAKFIKEIPLRKSIKNLAEALSKALLPLPKEEVKKKAKGWKLGSEMDQFGEGKIKAIKARTQSFEKLFKKTSMQLFADQKKRAVAALKGTKSVKVKTVLLDEEYEIKVTMDLFKPIFGDLTEKEGKEALTLIGLDPADFDIGTPSIQEFLKKNTKRFSESVTQKTSTDLRKLIADGLEAGDAIDELTQSIEDYAGFQEFRAETIARTETIRAQGECERVAWEESGVVASITWYTALDERVDDDCSFLHGKEIDIDESFLSQDDLTEFGINDYDGAIDAPPLHPNCRCTLLPVVK